MAERGMYMLTSLLGAGYLFNRQQRQAKGDIIKEQPVDLRDKGVISMYYNTLHVQQDAEKVPNKNYQGDLIYNILGRLDPEAQGLIKKHNVSAQGTPTAPDWGIVMDRPRTGADTKDRLQVGGSLVPGKEDFTHNNMVPFYSGNITQNMSLDNRSKEGKLEIFTGQFKLNRPQKQETASLFDPVKGLTNIFGSREKRDMSRYKPNNTGKKTNELPFEQVNVGPGLNQGFTDDPSGGFHNTLRIMPKGIEQLRVDPVLESEGRIKAGKSRINKRGLVSQMYKYQPELLVENKKGERNFTTVGAVHGRTLRPKVMLRDTNRKKSRFLINGATATTVGKRIAPKTQKSKRQTYRGTPYRNAASSVKKVNDYGKSGYRNHVTKRSVTGTRTHIIGPTGTTKRTTNRLNDKARKTRKQHFVNNRITYGYAGLSKPGAAPSYNPLEWAARSTIRETTEDLNHLGLARPVGAGAAPAYNPVDYAARTTIRETTENYDHLGFKGLQYGGVAPAYNPADYVARGTIRETTENNNYLGAYGGLQRKHIVQNQDNARTTIRETTATNNHLGVHSGIRRKHIALPKDKARSTIRETTERNDHLAGATSTKRHIVHNQDKARGTIRETTEQNNHMGGVTGNRRHVVQNQDKARTTIRETTERNDHMGGATGTKRHIAQNQDKARTTIRETTERNDHMGGATGTKRHIAQNQDKARTTIRETTERNTHIGGAAGTKRHIAQNQDKARTTIRETTERNKHIGNVGSAQSQSGKGYITNKYTAKNTNRQFTSDNAYTGIANAKDRKSKSYDDAYNARLNINKEKIAKGRAAMSGGPRLGHQEINMEIKKLDSDRINKYAAVKTNTMGNMYNPDAITDMTNTTEKNYLPLDDERLDTAILDAYKRNPLTQSLSSWA